MNPIVVLTLVNPMINMPILVSSINKVCIKLLNCACGEVGINHCVDGKIGCFGRASGRAALCGKTA